MLSIKKMGMWLVLCLMGMCSSAWADVNVSAWGLGSATPDQVKATLTTAFPGSHIVEKGNTLSIKQVVIEKIRFSVLAQFATVQGKQVLSKVTMDGRGDDSTKAFVALTEGLDNHQATTENLPGNVMVYGNDQTTMRATFNGSNRMVLVFEKNKNAPAIKAPEQETAKSRVVTVLEWIGGIAGVLLVFYSFQFVGWWIVGGVLGYILGNWAVGLMLGIICAVIHLIVRFFTSRSRTTLVYVPSTAPAEQNGPGIEHPAISPPAINPANGLPMVGGQTGTDIHGNSYGSNMNDSMF